MEATVANKNACLNDTSSCDENVLSMYLKEINRIPLLSREDEDKYARAAARGEKFAKDMLVKSNLRFVVNVAKKYQNQGLPLADLISEGNIGLINAIDPYDVDKGYHFISYAVWWIRQAILKAICEKSRMIRLPLNRANELVQIEKACKMLEGAMTEDEEVREIARLLEMDADHVADLVAVSREFVSLETPVFDERLFVGGRRLCREHDVHSSRGLRHRAEPQRGYQRGPAHVVRQGARGRRDRFGLNGHRAMSLKEIGDRFKLTKERIRQIEKSALKRLSQPNRTEVLESYVA